MDRGDLPEPSLRYLSGQERDMTSKVPAHELRGLMAWARRVEWRPYLQAVIAEHVEAALEEFGLSGEQLDSTLGDLASSTLWGCAFEDFLTRRFEPDAKNPAADYLQRRVWKERPPTREYIAALQLSVMSLYVIAHPPPGSIETMFIKGLGIQ